MHVIFANMYFFFFAFFVGCDRGVGGPGNAG